MAATANHHFGSDLNSSSGGELYLGCTGSTLFNRKMIDSKRTMLLPPANEVWGKVIFLHQFVILFTGRGAYVVAPGGAWLLRGGVVAPGGHTWLLQGGHAWLLWGGMRGCLGVCMVLFGGHAWFYSGGHAWFYTRGHAWFYLGGACVVFSVFSDTMRYGQWAGGTHPTGMHSCWV